MTKNNTPKNIKQRLAELAEISTIYRITRDELATYNPPLAASMEAMPEELVMVMAPEAVPIATAGKIIMLTDMVACGHEKKDARQRKQLLMERGYLLVDPADTHNFLLPDSPIRSFKEDLFPNSKVKERLSDDMETWKRPVNEVKYNIRRPRENFRR